MKSCTHIHLHIYNYKSFHDYCIMAITTYASLLFVFCVYIYIALYAFVCCLYIVMCDVVYCNSSCSHFASSSASQPQASSPPSELAPHLLSQLLTKPGRHCNGNN